MILVSILFSFPYLVVFYFIAAITVRSVNVPPAPPTTQQFWYDFTNLLPVKTGMVA